MPKFLEDKLKKQYGNNPGAIYGTMNKIGAMRGNKITAKGEKMEEKHKKDMGLGGKKVSHPKIKRKKKSFAEALNNE